MFIKIKVVKIFWKAVNPETKDSGTQKSILILTSNISNLISYSLLPPAKAVGNLMANPNSFLQITNHKLLITFSSIRSNDLYKKSS
jgi:hypothetical protein